MKFETRLKSVAKLSVENRKLFLRTCGSYRFRNADSSIAMRDSSTF